MNDTIIDDKIKIYQDVLDEGHYKLLTNNIDTIHSEDIIFFSDGIPGFEDLTDFIVCPIIDYKPFQVFQSLQSPEIGMIILPIINKFLSPANMTTDLLISIYQKEISPDNDIYFICRFSDKHITINTKAPLVINLNTKSGFQPIIDHDDLNTNDNAQLINKESDGK